MLRAERGVLITETRHGFVCANAGIDSSNLPQAATRSPCCREDPDASARRIRAEIAAAAGVAPAVIVADSFGRAWRLGQAEVAIGCAGLAPLDDWRGPRRRRGARAGGDPDRDRRRGRRRRRPGPQTRRAAVPAAVVRGLDRFVTAEDGPGAAALRRPRDEDLFR